MPCSPRGELDPSDIIPLIRRNTAAVVLVHASNVTGTIMPVAEVGAITRERDILLCVDASQTAGAVPIDVQSMYVDLLAFTGHKSLLGPQGTGGLYMRSGLENRIRPIVQGGTGSRSEFETQPDFVPDKYESGTPNTIGIAGLVAGARFILETGIAPSEAKRKPSPGCHKDYPSGRRGTGARRCEADNVRIVHHLRHELSSRAQARRGLPHHGETRLQCAPAAHKTIGTFLKEPSGQPGFFTTQEEIKYSITAVAEIASSHKERLS